MPCVHWEFSLGAFLCTCAEHNSSPFLRSGIANSRGKKMGLTRAKPGGYLITECGPEVFFHCNGFVFFQFCSYAVARYVLSSGRWKAGMGEKARTTFV